MNYLKFIAIILAILVILNLILFIFKLITPLIFWTIIIGIAIIAYYAIPYLRERAELKE